MNSFNFIDEMEEGSMNLLFLHEEWAHEYGGRSCVVETSDNKTWKVKQLQQEIQDILNIHGTAFTSRVQPMTLLILME